MKNILVLEDEVECNQLLCDIVTTSKERVTVYPAFDEKKRRCRLHLNVIWICFLSTFPYMICREMMCRA